MSASAAGESGLRAALPIRGNPTLVVLDDVRDERIRQLDKWGEQNHPSIDPRHVEGVAILREADYGDRFAARMVAKRYGIPGASEARDQCEHRARNDRLAWADIIVEELAEAVEAAALHGDGPELREEVVQVAAVAVAWLEALDRRAS